MNVAILHFHLNTGGVTTVIRQQVCALAEDCRVLVVSGEAPPDGFPGDVAVVPGLAYDTRRKDADGPDDIARAVDDAIMRRFPDGCDIIHVHNPTLAKNRHLLSVIERLRGVCRALFLHIHDFAEDGRLDVYPDTPYPADCHYGAINPRDETLLKAAGLSAHGVHFIPNTVSPMPSAPDTRNGSGLVLYPVRAIRRKNIGEAILLSAFFPDHLSLCITQPPNSPADQGSYRRWRRVANSIGAAVTFEAGLSNGFPALVADARAIVTTSVSEGFGFAFLEPWTAGKHVIGRTLPPIVSDMARRGVDLSGLYAALEIPMAWVDRRKLSRQWEMALARIAAVTRAPDAEKDLKADLHGLLSRSTIDFGLLHESVQIPVVERLFSENTAADTLKRLNPFLSEPLRTPEPDIMQRNRDVVLGSYSLSAYRDTLLDIYRRIVSTPVTQCIDRERLLASFLTTDNFSMLKWLPDDP